MKVFVTVNSEGYIDMWSNSKTENSIEVQTPKKYMNLINVCKVENGKVILDEKRQKEIISNQQSEKTELEELMEDSAEQLLYIAEVESAVQQSQQNQADLLLSLAEVGDFQMDWYEKVKEYFIGGYYTEEQVNKFVALKKITLEQAKEIISLKEAN